MGTGSSKQASSGTLSGAYAPPLQGITLPHLRPGRTFKIKVPPGKRPGQTMTIQIDGRDTTIEIPSTFNYNQATHFTYEFYEDLDKVIASTLSVVPGHVVALSKPIVFGSVSLSFIARARSGQQAMAGQIGKLMHEVQTQLLKQALDLGCNAVLGISFTSAIDSSGDDGNYKVVNVLGYGTPCIAVPAADIPAVIPDAVMEPIYEAQVLEYGV